MRNVYNSMIYLHFMNNNYNGVFHIPIFYNLNFFNQYLDFTILLSTFYVQLCPDGFLVYTFI